MSVPVVVDLWAPWCGPCKTLGPMIEKVIDDANAGAAEPRVVLAKVNVDENPQTSSAFRVQSIPAVYALRSGQVVDGFMGAQPEAALREFVARLLPSDTELTLEALVRAGDEASLREAIALRPGHVPAVSALATLYVEADRYQDALDVLATVPETDEVRAIAARARVGLTAGSPENLEVERELAELLPRVKSDDEARARFVDLLAILGPDHPATAGWRKKLSTYLY